MLTSVVIFEPIGQDLAALRRAFREAMPAESEVQLVSNIQELLRTLSDWQRQYLVVVSQNGPNGEARVSIEDIRKSHPEVPIVVVATEGNVDVAARAVEAGATDFLVMGDRLPERIGTLLQKLRGLFEAIDRNRKLDAHNARLRKAIQTRFEIIGQSRQMRDVVDKISLLAKIPRPVLILGERGTGKELVAKAIHFTGGSETRPIVTVNCAAFNDALLESELFGHEKGAFTGADTARQGKFEQADGGTLFLDEIGNMSLPFQQKILRVVEYGRFTRVGGLRELETSARVITATNCDLTQRIRDGAFLPDLYDRLAFEVIEIAPLRERVEDIETLAWYFLNQFTREIPAFKGKTLSRSSVAALKRYPFPGNVRELKNIIERATYRDTTDEITPADIGLRADDGRFPTQGSFQEKMTGFARRLIEDALRETEGNQAAAARLLGLSYHQFRYYSKKYAST